MYSIFNHNWRNISTIYILLTPWSRVLLEKLTGSAASQEIPRIFGTRRFLTVLTNNIYIYIYIYICVCVCVCVCVYKTRLASNEIFSPSNKIHRKVGRTKDLSATRYVLTLLRRNRNCFCLKSILLHSIATLLNELSCFRFVQVTHVCIPANYEEPLTFSVRARSEPGGTPWRTGGEVKGKLANGVGSHYSHATSERGLSSITQADAHTSAASSRLNWRPHRFKWTRPFRGKTKSGFCACAITFRTSYNSRQELSAVVVLLNTSCVKVQ